jgi:cell division protein FtsQ
MSPWGRGVKRRRSVGRYNHRSRPGRGKGSAAARSRSRPGWIRFVLCWTRRALWAAAIGTVVWGGLLAYREVPPLAAEWFEIRHVKVTGSGQVTREEVVKLMGLMPGETLLSLDRARAVDRLESHPWIKEATVSSVPLHTVTVRIQERKPVAVLKSSSLNLLLDVDGHVLSVVKPDDHLQLPVLHGIDPNQLIQGEGRSRQAAQSGIQVAGLMLQEFQSLPTVDARDPSNLVASVDGVHFRFGAPPFEEKWIRYRQVQRTLRQTPTSHDAGSEIDLRYSSRVIVRERG